MHRVRHQTVVALVTAAATMGSVTSCGQLPGADVSCKGVPTTECEAAYAVAVTDGLFLDDGMQVLGAVVRPTVYRQCPGVDELLYDVSFEVEGQSEPVVVSVGRKVGRELIVCTY